jgi:two-component system, NarL family, response regulator EvgA
MHTVLIVDDHPVIRLAVRVLLEKHGLQVVAETDNGVDAIQLVREHEPDVVILDIGIPKLDGLTVISRIKSLELRTQVHNPQRRSASAVSRSAPVGSSTRKKT